MKCDVRSCRKSARYNFQKVWVAYRVLPDDYRGPVHLSDQSPEGEDNAHLCRDHAAENFREQWVDEAEAEHGTD